MKKYLFIAFFIPLISFSQIAKKPTLMVVPGDAWCNQHKYVMNFKDADHLRSIPDYRAAVENDLDLLPVIAKIDELLADRGFPAKALDQVIKSLELEGALDISNTNRQGGSVLESPVDKILKRASSDIVLQVSWKVNQIGPKKSITFTLRGLDAYTNKEIASISGTGKQSFQVEVPLLLEEAIVKDMDNFLDKLQKHFEDMFENGREITVRILVWESWDEDLYSEYDGEELRYIVEDWFYDHAKMGRFSTATTTETYMLFEQVRMPLFDERNRGIDARRWVRNLQKYLQAAPYNIPSKLDTRGLGQATLTLGAK